MQQTPAPKPVIWVGPARRELKDLPREVQRTMGIALWFAQQGATHPAASPRKGRLAGGVIYVLCAFRKKAKSGVATPKLLLDRVAERLRQARRLHEETGGSR